MGYARGEQWDEDKIKARILEVVQNTNLNRMPSRSEVEQYYGDCKLTNAISKRMGWYALAKEMGLVIKDSETYFGKRYEEKAKEYIISLGYEVKRMPTKYPYDLLVEDCLKVDVKASRLYTGENGNFFSCNLDKQYCTCDIYIIFLINEDNTTRDILVIPSKFVATNTQISIGEKTSKYYKFSHKWDYLEQYINFSTSVI